MKSKKTKARVSGTFDTIVRPLRRDSVLRHMRPPTKEFPYWYYTGPWPNMAHLDDGGWAEEGSK